MILLKCRTKVCAECLLPPRIKRAITKVGSLFGTMKPF